jgi:ATPase subunit of ABC transporter with duplicated ATPase domains
MGKSSLLALILGEPQTEAGELPLPSPTVIGHVAQEAPAVGTAAIEYVIDGDRRQRELQHPTGACAPGELEHFGAESHRLHNLLTDSSLYEADNKDRLTRLLQEQALITKSLEKTEAEWLTASEELETANTRDELVSDR